MAYASTSNLPQRLIALVVSVLVSLAAGTPYLYGVFSPQLVQRVGLTTSDSATISLATNIGSGIGGLPGGLVIDHYGPQISILLGSVGIFAGYLGLNHIYENRIASLPLICVSMAFVGSGSITCFFATLKAAQANFPKHRGTAGAFPVSAFGLSATIFSVIAATTFSDNTGGLLLFLSLFCGAVTFAGSFFVHVHINQDHHDEEAIPVPAADDSGEESALISRSNSSNSLIFVDESGSNILPKNKKSFIGDKAESLRGSFSFWGIGERTPRSSVSSTAAEAAPILQNVRDSAQSQSSSSIPLSSRKNSSTSLGVPQASQNSKRIPVVQVKQNQGYSKTKSPIDIIKERLTDKIFLTHFLVVGLCSGICQMYIYSVGFVVTAQYNYGNNHNNDGESEVSKYLLTRAILAIRGGAPVSGGAAALQAVQVSVISLASFGGRLVSGFLSDYIHKRFHIHRLWIVVGTSLALATGQFINIVNVNNPHLITLASATIGGCYGLAFGTYPAVIADHFGTKTFSTTWGLICVAPLIVLFSLNKYFGYLYDHNSDPETGICYKGNECYKGAFEFSFSLSFVIFVVVLVLIAVQRKSR